MLAHDVTGGCWQYDSRGWTFPPIVCKFCCRATNSIRGAFWLNGTWHGSAHEAEGRVTEILHTETSAPVDSYRCLLNISGDKHSTAVATVMWHTGPTQQLSAQNEERLNQLIHTKWQITTRVLCTEPSVGFNELERTLETTEYHKVCARWVLQIPIWRPWSMLQSLAGSTYHTHRHTVQIWRLPTSSVMADKRWATWATFSWRCCRCCCEKVDRLRWCSVCRLLFIAGENA
jgi:hypothetical protein